MKNYYGTRLDEYINDLVDEQIEPEDLKSLLRELKESPEKMQMYADYLLVKRVLNKDYQQISNIDISKQVMQKITENQADANAVSKKILQFPHIKRVSSLAIAASTFLAVTLGIHFYQPESDLVAENTPVNLLELNLEELSNNMDFPFYASDDLILNFDEEPNLNIKDLTKETEQKNKQFIFEASTFEDLGY